MKIYSCSARQLRWQTAAAQASARGDELGAVLFSMMAEPTDEEKLRAALVCNGDGDEAEAAP